MKATTHSSLIIYHLPLTSADQYEENGRLGGRGTERKGSLL